MGYHDDVEAIFRKNFKDIDKNSPLETLLRQCALTFYDVSEFNFFIELRQTYAFDYKLAFYIANWVFDNISSSIKGDGISGKKGVEMTPQELAQAITVLIRVHQYKLQTGNGWGDDIKILTRAAKFFGKGFMSG